MVDYGAVDLYWGRCGRIWRCRSSGDGVVGYVAVDLYWGYFGREWGDRSLLGTEW